MIKFLILTLLITGSFPNSDWELKKEKAGIRIYTRSVDGSSFAEFKGITTIENSNLPDVLSVILDVETYESLFPDCINPKILKRDGKWYDIHYIQTKGPFPVKDRDSIFEQKTEIDENKKYARVTLKPLPDYIPEKENMVRIHNGTGFWELSEDKNNVQVIYQFHGDPAGEVPAWLVNSFVVTHPLKTLENLKKRVQANKQTNEY
jgi:hypothetical protein